VGNKFSAAATVGWGMSMKPDGGAHVRALVPPAALIELVATNRMNFKGVRVLFQKARKGSQSAKQG
jgi:hypothetical protein